MKGAVYPMQLRQVYNMIKLKSHPKKMGFDQIKTIAAHWTTTISTKERWVGENNWLEARKMQGRRGNSMNLCKINYGLIRLLICHVIAILVFQVN